MKRRPGNDYVKLPPLESSSGLTRADVTTRWRDLASRHAWREWASRAPFDALTLFLREVGITTELEEGPEFVLEDRSGRRMRIIIEEDDASD